MRSHIACLNLTALTHTVRKVVVVSRHPLLQPVLDTVQDAGNYDLVFVESIGNAYSHIKRVAPDLVIVYLEIDDSDTIQVLSMLKLDSGTSSIPVVTCMTTHEASRFEEDCVEFGPGVPTALVAVSMN